MTIGHIIENNVLRGTSTIKDFMVFKFKAAKESDECKAFFMWCENHRELKGLVTHYPNEAKRSFSLAKFLQSIGLRKGVSDYFIPVMRGGYGGMWIEMKRSDKTLSRISLEQKNWLAKMDKQGYKTYVAYGYCDAAQAVTAYLDLPSPIK